MPKMQNEMFDPNNMEERIGEYEKNKYLVDNLAGVDKFFRKRMRRYTTEFSYDVMANEIPYFKTINYTEYATSFMMVPLSQIMREQQIKDAYYDEESDEYPVLDWVSYFRSNVENKVSNKYEDRVDFTKDPQYDRELEALVILPGSNKIKSRVCLNKLNTIQSIGSFLRTKRGYKVTNPEGYVAIKKGGAVKLVDRLEFSRANFTMAKDWVKG